MDGARTNAGRCRGGASPHIFLRHDVVEEPLQATARAGWPMSRMCSPIRQSFRCLLPSPAQHVEGIAAQS